MAIKTFTADLNGGDAVTADNDLIFKIYGATDGYVTAIHTSGSHTSDSDVTVTGDSVSIANVDVGAETTFKITSIDEAANESTQSAAFAAQVEEYDQTNAASIDTEVNDRTDWFTTGVTITSSTDDVHHGTYALKLVAQDGTGDRAEYKPDHLDALTAYRMTVWAKQTIGTTGEIKSWNAVTGFSVSPQQALTSSWAEYTITFSTGSDATAFIARFYAADGGSAGDTIYLDEISLVKV